MESGRSYRMNVGKDVFTALKLQDIDLDTAMEFFATQVENMLRCKPNYNYYGSKLPIWVMRGYYPGTTVMFKMVMIQSGEGSVGKISSPMYVKITIPTPSWKKKSLYVSFEGNELRDRLEKVMENKFFGANHELTPMIKDKIRRPRCMSPKGCAVHRLKRKRRKCAS